MAQRTKNVILKKRGRPATGNDPVRTLRLSEEFILKVDDWAAKQDDKPGRSEAIRRLVEIGLKVGKPIGRTLSTTAARASELAGAAIDRASDPTASPDQRAVRKRRVLEGPSAFRDSRKDR